MHHEAEQPEPPLEPKLVGAAALLRAGRPFFSGLGCRQQNDQTESTTMHTFSAVIERCPETGLLVGYVPGFPGAHSQGETLDELQANLEEVISMLLEDGEPALESDFVGLQQISVPA
jgi:predicted RNase H-like HicB family nuclease